MRIKKTYTVTESEKNRIRGLHNNVKNLLREEAGCCACGDGTCTHKCCGSAWPPSTPKSVSRGGNEREVGEAYDGRTWEDQIKDLSKGIPTPGNPSGGMVSGGGGCCTCPDFPFNCEHACCPDSRGKVAGTKELNESPFCDGGCPEGHSCTWSGCMPDWDIDDFTHKTTGGKKGRTKEMRETTLPTGWTMRTKEEIEEENIMDDLYEVWSGHEDDKALRESMMDDGTIKEQWYELPLRFGNKRLTESQLLRMIDTIIK